MASGVIALALSAALAFSAYELTRSQLLGDREQGAQSQAYLNARLVMAALGTSEPDVPEVLSSLGGNSRSTTVARIGGEWFTSALGIGPDDLPTGLARAVGEGAAGRQRVRIDDSPYVAVGVALPSVDARYFELVPLDDLERSLSGLSRGLALAAAMTTLAGATVGWYASRRALRPLAAMSAAAEGIADGTLDTRLDAVGDTDLEPLVSSFNRMADVVQARIDRESRFASDVSHEIRAPLAAMESAIAIARRRAADRASADAALDLLQERVRLFHQLVLDLLEMSRVEAGVARLQLTPVAPRSLVADVLERAGRSGVAVDVDHRVPHVVLADEARLMQMLANLVENADRYAGGVRRVEVAAADGCLTVAVEDRGPGVADHERSQIFERFARGEASARGGAPAGTGLGLSLVREHAKLHGGDVRVEDRSGGGARFVIEIPLRSAS